MTGLERAAERWIEPHPYRTHLLRARDWAVELDPDAGEALRVAALTHDVERMIPGGPIFDALTTAPDDEDYNREHAERSAGFVREWLVGRGAEAALVDEAAELVRLHEWGGTPTADVMQAADSLSFLEVNWEALLGWIREGRARPEHVRAKHDWMFERIRIERARVLARPFYERALASIA